jgi:hypothetical protein
MARTNAATIQALLRPQAPGGHVHRQPMGLATPTPPAAGLSLCQGSLQAGSEVLWVIPHPRTNWDVAYRLQLLVGAKLHDVFHVGLLKPFKGEPPAETPALPPVHHGRVCAKPEAVLRGRVARGRHELLVQSKSVGCERYMDQLGRLSRLYPAFQFEDELLAEEGRDVLLGIRYQRRRNRVATNQGITPVATDRVK